jgi:hypothetical protein
MGATGIPTALVKTFRNAVYAYENAKQGLGGDWNPSIPSDDKTYADRTIGEIAVMASAYDDLLPGDILAYLTVLAPRDKKAFPQTFAAAGVVLKTMYDDHIKALPSRGVRIEVREVKIDTL